MRCVVRPLGQSGFSIVEAMVATAIGLVAVGAFATFNVAQMYTLRNQSNQLDLQTSARSIADLFAREVRHAGSNPTCDAAVSPGVAGGQISAVQLHADLDGDGKITSANENVTYTLDSTNQRITRTDNAAGRTDTLWSGTSIAGSQLLYFDANGNALAPVSGSTALSAAQLLNVRRVALQIVLTAQVGQPNNAMQQTAAESANIEIRNRYFVSANPNCVNN
jgi:Tfp pilus assembly protein PilW